MGATLASLVSYVGERINQNNASGVSVDGIVSKASVELAIQNRYDELFSLLAKNNEQDFTVEVDTDFGPASDDATSTGWYDLSGILTNPIVINWLGVKYSTTDTVFARATLRGYGDTFELGSETFSESSPRYIAGTIPVSGVATSALQILPHNTTTDVTNGLRIRYTQRPAVLSASVNVTDVIPVSSHWYIGVGALADAYQIAGGDYSGLFNLQLSLWEKYKTQALIDYTPKSSAGPRRIRGSRMTAGMRRRSF